MVTVPFLTFGRSVALLSVLCLGKAVRPPDEPAKQGHNVADFELKDLDGNSHKLSQSLDKGPVVLLELRGYPGYQCPFCTKQVAEFVASADKFKADKATVILVYPGEADGLKEHAKEFAGAKNLPANFLFLLDPDYTFTNAWHLRWNEAGETAYPATYLIDSQYRVRFSKISKSHGDRATAAQVLEAMKALK
jgi:thioredoxin-dependent peroxiredoxin